MNPSSKKRKAENIGSELATSIPEAVLTPEDGRKIIDAFSLDQLRDIVAADICRGDPGILADVRSIADRDPSQRKLFIRGLGLATTTDAVCSLFSAYGEIEEASVIVDKATGRSKGYGFITFRPVDGALLALKEPSKKVDGRITVTHLAAAGSTGAGTASTTDVSQRKIYVANVPADLPSDRLLTHFSSYGEIEEGPLGFDIKTGKFRGFALLIYKTAEGARTSLMVPNKNIDGHNLVCKLAFEGKKGKHGAPAPGSPSVSGIPGQPLATGGNMGYDCRGLSAQSSFACQYGGPRSSISSYGGYSNCAPPGASRLSAGTPGLSSVGGQMSSNFGALRYSDGLSDPYGSSSQYGAPSSEGYGGYGMGSSLYRMPSHAGGVPSGGYLESRHYPLASSAYKSQPHQLAGSSPGQRIVGGRLYPNMPPYY